MKSIRRAVLSLNRLLRHEIGMKPGFGSRTRGETLPDPCPELTDKIVRIKEERVNQTAHLIIAQALGVRLKKPTLSADERKRGDVHGEYEVIPGRSPVDFIVLEDLARYTTDKSRSRSENSRLMKWCHRAINEKVKMLAEPFGIPVLEVFASYSSKFDARTGAPGFRAVEVTSADRPFWEKTIEKNGIASQVELEAQPPLPVRRLHNFIYCSLLFSFQWVENVLPGQRLWASEKKCDFSQPLQNEGFHAYLVFHELCRSHHPLAKIARRGTASLALAGDSPTSRRQHGIRRRTG